MRSITDIKFNTDFLTASKLVRIIWTVHVAIAKRCFVNAQISFGTFKFSLFAFLLLKLLYFFLYLIKVTI